MTIRHIVLMSFVDGPSEQQLSRLGAGVAELAAAVPAIAAASWGPDVTSNANNHDFAIVFDFADRAAYEQYRGHPEHQRFIDVHMREIAVEKARVQYVVPDDIDQVRLP